MVPQTAGSNIRLKVAKIPNDELTLCNCIVVNPQDWNTEQYRHVMMMTSPGQQYLMTTVPHKDVSRGMVGVGALQRKWTNLSLNQEIQLAPAQVPHRLQSMTIELDLLQRRPNQNQPVDQFDTEKMAMDFLAQFRNRAFTSGELLAYQFPEKKDKTMSAVVREMHALDLSNPNEPKTFISHTGLIMGNTVITFEKAENANLALIGKAKGKSAQHSIISPDWDFSKMGIGGLDKEFAGIFRRAFASRVFPPELVQQLGLKHVRGILLFGPPGTGKTLMARQISKMLNAREPKIISGPQILDKYVGESESNIRKLFGEAEEEEKRLGIHSALHIIIFDEIDAICKARGSVAGSTSVHDTVVNQLLAKIDGVEQLNNILVIGMTNRLDMIDEALLRPGRLEVKMEISLPDEYGRLQILNIHTNKLKESNKLADDVQLSELAKRTKNFSGAEIEGLVRAATFTAMNRLIKASSKIEIDGNAIDNLTVSRDDFEYALEHDIKPAFGTSEDVYSELAPNGIVVWGEPVKRVLDTAELIVSQVRASDRTRMASILVSGPVACGKSALAGEIAKRAGFPFVRLCSPRSMVGHHEQAKCLAIKKAFDDAHKSAISCIVLDDVETLLDYAPIGPRYSNLVLQALKVLLKQQPPHNRRLLVIATTSSKQVLDDLGLSGAFSSVIGAPNITVNKNTATIYGLKYYIGLFF